MSFDLSESGRIQASYPSGAYSSKSKKVIKNILNELLDKTNERSRAKNYKLKELLKKFWNYYFYFRLVPLKEFR
jgi:hypothetical protein